MTADKLSKIKKLNHDELLLYSLLAIVILTTMLFLAVYLIWVPFWPARAVHVVYLLYHFFLIYLLKRKKYYFIKINILMTNIIQLSLAAFLWFPLTTQYYYFYFLLPMGAFAIMNLDNRKEKYSAFAVCLLSFVLFFMNSFMKINFYMIELNNTAKIIISFLTTISTFSILIIYFYLHAYFLARKRKELEYLANTDSLTDIHNRRSFYKLGDFEFKMARQFGHCFTLLLLDIDYFKKVNDTYGHDAGDDVLRQISRTIKDNIRHSDLFARHGGEEFTLLLRKTEIDIGMKTAEKLRKSLKTWRLRAVQTL